MKVFRNITAVLDRQQKILDALAQLPKQFNPSPVIHKISEPVEVKIPPAEGLRHRKGHGLAIRMPDRSLIGQNSPQPSGTHLLGIKESEVGGVSAASTPGYSTKKPTTEATRLIRQRASSLSPADGSQRGKQRVKRASGGSGRKILPRFPEVPDMKRKIKAGKVLFCFVQWRSQGGGGGGGEVFTPVPFMGHALFY